MSELDDSFAKLLGRQPTDGERQELYRVREALGLGNNDALWLVLMALQHYESLYAGIPASIKEAAQRAAGSAAGQAQAEVGRAVAALVPTVESAVGKAAAAAVNRALSRIQLGRSVFTAWLAMVALGVAFGLGWLFGGHVFAAVHGGSLKWGDFWDYTEWGVGIGLVAPAFLLVGLFVKDDYGGMGVVGGVAAFIAFALAMILGFNVLMVR